VRTRTRRLTACVALAAVPLLAACSSSNPVAAGASAAQGAIAAASSAAAVASSAAAAAAGDTPSPTPSDPSAASISTSPADSSSPADSTPAPDGAKAMCDSLKELGNAKTQSPADQAALFHKVAGDIRSSAPAAVAKGAASYATVLDAVGTAVGGGTTSTVAMQQAMGAALQGSGKDVSTFLLWTASHCA
jgi:hypothetical protein